MARRSRGGAAEVAALLGVNRFTVSRWHNDPSSTFPRPAKLARNVLRWRRADVDAWVESRIEGNSTKPSARPRPMPKVKF